MISRTKGNNAILSNKNTFLVRNIVVVDQVVKLICQGFTTKEPFFNYPLDSSKLDITFVQNMDARLIVLNLSDVAYKVVLMPFNDGFVSYPMMHSFMPIVGDLMFSQLILKH